MGESREAFDASRVSDQDSLTLIGANRSLRSRIAIRQLSTADQLLIRDSLPGERRRDRFPGPPNNTARTALRQAIAGRACRCYRAHRLS